MLVASKKCSLKSPSFVQRIYSEVWERENRWLPVRRMTDSSLVKDLGGALSVPYSCMFLDTYICKEGCGQVYLIIRIASYLQLQHQLTCLHLHVYGSVSLFHYLLLQIIFIITQCSGSNHASVWTSASLSSQQRMQQLNYQQQHVTSHLKHWQLKSGRWKMWH